MFRTREAYIPIRYTCSTYRPTILYQQPRSFNTPFFLTPPSSTPPHAIQRRPHLSRFVKSLPTSYILYHNQREVMLCFPFLSFAARLLVLQRTDSTLGRSRYFFLLFAFWHFILYTLTVHITFSQVAHGLLMKAVRVFDAM